MAKKKSNRGANLRGVGNPCVGTKRAAAQIDRSDSDNDPSFVPDDAGGDAEASPTLTRLPDVVPEEAEPGEKRTPHRQTVLAAEGPGGLQRLDAQAKRKQRLRKANAAAEGPSAQSSIEAGRAA